MAATFLDDEQPSGGKGFTFLEEGPSPDLKELGPVATAGTDQQGPDTFIPEEGRTLLARNKRIASENPDEPLVPIGQAVSQVPTSTLGTIARYGDVSGIANLSRSIFGREKTDEAAAGLMQGGANVAQSLTTPSNLALMAALGGAPALVQKGAAAAFTAQGLRQLPQSIEAVQQAQTPREAIGGATEAVGNLAMAALGAREAARTPEGGWASILKREPAQAETPPRQLFQKAEPPQASTPEVTTPAVEAPKVNASDAPAPFSDWTAATRDESSPAAGPEKTTEPVQETRQSFTQEPVAAGESISEASAPEQAPEVQTPERTAGSQGMQEGASVQELPNGEKKSLFKYERDANAIPDSDGLVRESGEIATPETSSRTLSTYEQKAKELREAEFKGNTPTLSHDLKPGDVIDYAGRYKTVAGVRVSNPLTKLKAEHWVDFTDGTAQKFFGRTEVPLVSSPRSMKMAGNEAGFISVPKVPQIPFRKFTTLDEATTGRSAKIQASVDEAARAQKEIQTFVKDPLRREAIALYADEGGDLAKIASQIPTAKTDWYKKTANAALTLTPEELKLADHIKGVFATMKARGEAHGILETARENYVPHVWERPKGSLFGGSALKDSFKSAKGRTLETFYEGDQAGLKPKTLDVAKLVPAYLHEMNKVIADRQFVKDLANGVAKDGRPLVNTLGGGQRIEAGDKATRLIFPKRRTGTVDTTGYRVMPDQPALSKWKWAEGDENGQTMVKGDLQLHPEAYKRLNSMFRKGPLREWYDAPDPHIGQKAVKFLDSAQGAIKREMFGFLSPFHQVQEGVHAVGHLVNPFFGLKDIDMRKPEVMDAAKHGLMIHPDRTTSGAYMEGVGAEGTFITKGMRKLGKPGGAMADVVDGYQHYLFHSYIPRLKYTTYEKIVERNMKRYASELASGKRTASDIKLLSAQQTNAAYGHLSYDLLDRSPFAKEMSRLLLLAPDFLEARGRFVGQAAKGLLGDKQGAEQLKAIAVLAMAQAGTAFTLAQLSGGTWDWKHPFEMRRNGRTYSMRSVPEDLVRAFTDSRQFLYGRVSPGVRAAIQGITGLNYRGEKSSVGQTIGELVASAVPLTLRSAPGFRSLTETQRNNPLHPLEQFVSSLGVQVKRASPINDTYQLAQKWKDSQGMPEDKGNYPVSKYQQLRYALEDQDEARARKEYQGLLASGATRDKLMKGFVESVDHPFTGTLKGDRQFAASLSSDDRKTYDDAVAQRKAILARFARIAGVSLPSKGDAEMRRLFR